jgi:hypothetical protein
MADNVKNFPLRITNPKTYPALAKEAKSKPGKWSVNTLINSILEEYQKKDKKSS